MVIVNSGVMVMARVPVVGYEGLYEVSDDGHVFSMRRNSNVSLCYTRVADGGCVVELTKDGVCLKHRVHRLVALAFIDNQKNSDYVQHIDCDKTNNKASNLKWKNSNYKKLKVCATDIATGNKRFFRTVNSTERHGFNVMAVRNCCSGRCKSYAGYKWDYIESSSVN